MVFAVSAVVETTPDKYADLHGMTVSQLRQARAVRSIHRGFALRDTNELSKLVNNGWVSDMPIPVRLVKLANELLGEPHENSIAKVKASRTPRFKEYANITDDQIGLELEIMT